MRDVSSLMARALALAERGGGGTSPNPMVGCVVVDESGAVLGEGYHARAGGPHAEVEAIRAAREAGRPLAGATFVVTLEPCAAFGRTPPCTDAIVAEGARRVVFAVEDPAQGKGGAERLRAAGIEVERGAGEREARRLIEAWLHFVATGRPFFHVKVAMTRSGHVTRGPRGERWITSPASRAIVHRLRRRHAAVMMGIGTLLADDPELTVRDWPSAAGEDLASGVAPDVAWPPVQPRRVVLDSRLRIPLASRLVVTAETAPVLVLCAHGTNPEKRAALEARGVEVAEVPPAPRGLDLGAVARALAERAVTGVLVEPGPTLQTALFEAGLVDRWTTFTAPDRVEEDGALPSPAPEGLVLADVERSPVGPDEMMTGLVRRAP